MVLLEHTHHKASVPRDDILNQFAFQPAQKQHDRLHNKSQSRKQLAVSIETKPFGFW